MSESRPSAIYYYSSKNHLEKDIGNAGYDLRSTIECAMKSHSRSLIPTGIFLSMPINIYAHIHPRSGLALKGIDVSAGIVDSSYRGELKVVLVNNSDTDFHISVGDRIAQLIFHPLYMDIPVWVERLEESFRGSNGFGSSGMQ
jgi:dUTP pyrophosphatase